MERVQIDLVDMKSLVVTKGGKSYRYVLSIMDVFSRYVVLRALSDKTATAVADQRRVRYNWDSQNIAVRPRDGV